MRHRHRLGLGVGVGVGMAGDMRVKRTGAGRQDRWGEDVLVGPRWASVPSQKIALQKSHWGSIDGS